MGWRGDRLHLCEQVALPLPVPTAAAVQPAVDMDGDQLLRVVSELFKERDTRSVRAVMKATGLSLERLRPRLARLDILFDSSRESFVDVRM